MRFVAGLLYLILLVPGVLEAGTLGYKVVDPLAVKGMLARDEAVVVDLRETSEVLNKVVPVAAHLPYSSFRLSQLPQADGKYLVLLCQTGKNSENVAQRLADGGRNDIYVVAGGFRAWENAGLPLNLR
jgi:rhodanese-related sulfurtransferase